MSRKPMTLRQLHARLGDIIEQNKARGWDERNDLPTSVVVQMGKTWRSEKRFTIINASAGMEGTLSGQDYCGVMTGEKVDK